MSRQVKLVIAKFYFAIICMYASIESYEDPKEEFIMKRKDNHKKSENRGKYKLPNPEVGLANLTGSLILKWSRFAMHHLDW